MSSRANGYESGMSHARVLIVEDDDDVRALVRTVVERAGMEAREARDGAEGLRAFYESRPNLVVLDISMPVLDGWQVLERIRELSDTPVLMLTASTGELDKVRGLREGADDYLTKPFGRQELVARIEAILRRSGATEVGTEILADEALEIDFPQRRVTAGGQEVELTPTEFKLLAAFVRHPNQVLSQDQIIEMVWSDTPGRSQDQVKLYVGYLRRKLSDSANLSPIETVRGFGYRYSPQSASQTD
jgi:DNA-binding response OmpR family regulator